MAAHTKNMKSLNGVYDLYATGRGRIYRVHLEEQEVLLIHEMLLVKGFITGHRTVHEDHGSLSYTAFVVDVYVNGVKHVIDRRYSEFEDLHKTLKKQMTVPIFPPKKVLNKSSKFIEERRIQLEKYLQELLQSAQYTSELLEFLEIDKDADDDRLNDDLLDRNLSSSFVQHDGGEHLSMCPFAKSSSCIDENMHSREVSPDIILQGLYQALYIT